MILVTVGTQLPFDRLIKAVDRIAPDLQESVVAQVGRSTYQCQHLEAYQDINPVRFDSYLQTCSRVIAHAGIGSLLSAQRFNKPIIIVPRLAKFGEHRNDHQLATCRMLEGRSGISVVYEIEELPSVIANTSTSPTEASGDTERRARLISYISKMIVS